jgi:hypothetical protein
MADIDKVIKELAARHGLSVDMELGDDDVCMQCRMYIRCGYSLEMKYACGEIFSGVAFKEELASFDMDAFQEEFIILAKTLAKMKVAHS